MTRQNIKCNYHHIYYLLNYEIKGLFNKNAFFSDCRAFIKRKLREFIAWTIAMNHFHNVTMVTKTLVNLVIISCAIKAIAV